MHSATLIELQTWNQISFYPPPTESLQSPQKTSGSVETPISQQHEWNIQTQQLL